MRRERILVGLLPVVIPTLALLASVMCESAYAASTSLSNFNEFPSATLANLTPDQQSLCKVANSLEGDSREGAAFGACERLLREQTLPAEFYRWAYLRRVLLHAVCSREDLALATAHSWIQRHPDDEINTKLRCVMVQFCAWRGSEHFKPTLQDLEAAGGPVFSAAPAPNMDLVEGHQAYAMALERLSSQGNRLELLAESRKHLKMAQDALELAKRNPKEVQDPQMDPAIAEQASAALGAKLQRLDMRIGSEVDAKAEESDIAVRKAVEETWQELFKDGEAGSAQTS